MDEKDKLDDQLIESQELEESPSEEVAEEQEQETPQDDEFQEEDQDEEVEEEQPEKPSRRENLRIQKLVSKLRERDEYQQPEQVSGIDYRTTLDAEDDVYTKLESDRKSYGDKRYQEGAAYAESIQFHTRLEIDAPKVASKYPQFDEDSPEFNPLAANALNEQYLRLVGYNPKTNTVKNPNIRYSEYVEAQMELANELAGQRVEATRKNIAKQAASTGLRPDGSMAKRMNLNKAPQAMTDEELDAVISRAIPKR